MGKTRRKKKRTVVGNEEGAGIGLKPPQTFVMERGSVGRSLHELVNDIRHVMEPYTASKLKVTRRNILKDFVHVAGPLGVTHFIMLSKTNDHVNLKIAKLPRGPTLTFHLSQFALTREVLSSLSKPPPVADSMFLTPAMLVLNNFSSDSKPSNLISTMLQNMFPTLNVQTVKLSLLRRCVLWSYNKETSSIEFRHYCIKVVPRGISRGIRKIAQSRIPNLSRYEDISEYVLGGGASESEGEEAEGEVILPQDLPGRGNMKQQQSAIKLYELGPRLTLRLVKIESGLCTGEVLHHELIHKTEKEIKQLRKTAREKKKLKIMRKKEQEENVLRKQQNKELQRKQEWIRQGKLVDDEKEPDISDDDDDVEWYRKEVGVAPDSDLLLDSRHKKRKRNNSLIIDNEPSVSKKQRLMKSKVSSKSVFKPHPTKKTAKKVFTGRFFRKKALTE